ncbi:MFS transporter [Patescibacteria group bacterium]|nr:MFS transporter [Patescibacteria group bacterium]MBU1922226.1 MFS transporter [Patescibacteria group bacterium]
MSRVLKFLIASDILIWSGVSFVTPIIAIFIKEQLVGGSIFAVGLATAMAYLVRAAILVPVGNFNDRDRGNRREFITLVLGILIMSLTPLSYIFINRVEYFFLAQIIYGVGLALYTPGWLTVWTRFLDGFHEGRSWSIYASFLSAAIGLSALAGGYFADLVGFKVVFILVAVFGVASVIFISLVKKEIYAWPKSKSGGNRARV